MRRIQSYEHSSIDDRDAITTFACPVAGREPVGDRETEWPLGNEVAEELRVLARSKVCA